MADSLSTRIDALISGADALSAAADSVATITSGSDVLVSNFDHVEEVFDNLQLFLSELKTNSWYAPVGLISPFGGLTAPTGWLLCDGSAVSQTTYSALHTVLGANAYGTDSGGNFYLPDLKGRVPFGLASGSSQFGARTSTEGTATASSRSTAHSHTVPDHTHSNGTMYARLVGSTQNVWYGQTGGSESWYANQNGGGLNIVNNAFSTFGGGFKVGGVTDGSSLGTANSGTAANPVPYAVANYIIKY